MTRVYNRKPVFWSAYLGMLLFGIGLLTLGSVLPDLMIKHSLDAVGAGTLFSIMPLGIIGGSLLFGPVCDRYGYKPLLVISSLLMFAGFEGLALTGTTGLLVISVLMIGLGGGAINGATNAVVADISTTGKGANLSLLGVFFGIGALGMPLLLSILEKSVDFEVIISATGFLALAAALIFFLVVFPPAKQSGGISMKMINGLISDSVILLIAFFLFFQSAFEGLINNWTTTYVIDHLSVSQGSALIALSSYVAGMTVTRLLIGSVFRNVTEKTLLFSSFLVIFAALVMIWLSSSVTMAAAAFALLGTGLAAGFPTMLGIVGNRYPDISGTAFSFVMAVALIGNILVNYSMGLVAENFGIKHLTTFTFAELALLAILGIMIFRKLKRKPTKL
ncbi:MAG TPA: MFS transporter [Bacteroidales bacterium]|nr:MFS transporter [Bacteroidales bacterium]